MYSEILKHILTSEDASYALADLEHIREAIFKTDEKAFEKEIDEKLPQNIAMSIKDSLSKSKMNKKEFIDGLLKELSELEPVSITIAFRPSASFTKEVAGRISNLIDTNFVIQFIHDPAVLGGAKITFKGKYADYTLERVINDAEGAQ